MDLDFGFGLDSFLSNMIGQESSSALPSLACPLCGSTSEDISRTGRVGCAKCYDIFSDMLSPYISRIHGNTSHTGKIPGGAGGRISLRRKLDGLKNDLRKAIDTQEFERAAELRDEIKKLEGEMGNE
jgi:protein arginine kinase activator